MTAKSGGGKCSGTVHLWKQQYPHTNTLYTYTHTVILAFIDTWGILVMLVQSQ